MPHAVLHVFVPPRAGAGLDVLLQIKHMEEVGVGRPSTYAPTIRTLLVRTQTQTQNPLHFLLHHHSLYKGSRPVRV